jgi:AAA15 family ATPase/GTPase
MIKQLNIKNFKSIKDLTMTCKKLNVFIGEPNSGKSNIIEALSLQSQNSFSQELNKDMFRYKSIGDLFYDFNINLTLEVNTDEWHTTLKYAIREDGTTENVFLFYPDAGKELVVHQVEINHDGNIKSGIPGVSHVCYYEYKRLMSFKNSYYQQLKVPFGENLPSLLLSNSEYKKWVSDFLKNKGLNLTFKPSENEILASKIVNDEIYSYPYFTLSETLQRFIFYNIALKSNNDSVLLFDEPETNTFPKYTKLLAENIALDKTNQFFITTHNPYLLLSLIEKSKIEDINVCIAQMKDYQTIISVLNSKQITDVLDLNTDVFFNFDKILDL